MLTTELIRKIRHIEISTRHLVAESFAGEYHSVFKGQGIEFEDVREYYAGDDIRAIDWNVTARMGSPYVRRYLEEREATVLLAMDASASGDFGSVGRFKRELAAELAAVLSFAATTNNDKVGLFIFTDRSELFIPPRKGRRHVLRLIRDVLVFKPEGRGTDIGQSLDTVNLLLKRPSVVFLISDFLAEPESFRRPLSLTNRRHDVIAIDLHDPLEREVPDVGLLLLEDAETDSLTWVDTSSNAWRDSFKREVAQLEAAKNQVFVDSNVDRIRVTTDRDYVAELNAFFKKRSRRLAR